MKAGAASSAPGGSGLRRNRWRVAVRLLLALHARRCPSARGTRASRL